MNKHLFWIIPLVIILLIGSYFVGTYNRLQVMDETVTSNWAQVENQLKRRNDLIPNLVSTVKGYATHERGVFADIANARAKLAGSMKNNDVKGVSQNDRELTGALSRLLLVVERYPDLKANQNFIGLQDELAGTENRLSVARRDYNESVKALNAKIRVFPDAIVARIANIKARDYFEVSESEKAAPKVEF